MNEKYFDHLLALNHEADFHPEWPEYDEYSLYESVIKEVS